MPSTRFPSRSSLNRSISLHSNVPLSFPESEPPQWTELGADVDEFYDAQEFTEVIPPRQNSAAKVRVASKTVLQAFDDTTLKVERKVPEVKLRKKTLPNAYRVLTGDALNLASCITPNLAAAATGNERRQGPPSWRHSASEVEFKKSPLFSSGSFRRVLRTFSTKNPNATGRKSEEK